MPKTLSLDAVVGTSGFPVHYRTGPHIGVDSTTNQVSAHLFDRYLRGESLHDILTDFDCRLTTLEQSGRHAVCLRHSFVLNAWLRRNQLGSFSLDAYIAFLRTGSFSLDAYVAQYFRLDAVIASLGGACTDDFSRVVSGGWGTSPIKSTPWTTNSGTLLVDGNYGIMTGNGDVEMDALTTWSLPFEVLVTLAVTDTQYNLGSTSGTMVWFTAISGNYARIELDWSFDRTTGQMATQVSVFDGAGNPVIDHGSSLLSIQPDGTFFSSRLQVDSVGARVRSWTGTEPSTWDTDDTYSGGSFTNTNAGNLSILECYAGTGDPAGTWQWDSIEIVSGLDC